MINTNKLKGLIVENQLTQGDVATELGMTPRTFYRKMERGVFDSDEIEQMIQLLHIQDPVAVFFANEVTQ